MDFMKRKSVTPQTRVPKKNKLSHVWVSFFSVLVFSLAFYFTFFRTPVLEAQFGGLKYIKNYGSYMHPDNWSVLQDKRGMIYIANNGCVLELDGVSRRIINIPNNYVRSLGLDEEGVVYVGGNNEFGYLAADDYGRRHYVSLLNDLKEKQKEFGFVQRINATKDGIYFRTKKFLFRWQPKTKRMDVWEPEKEFNASFSCNGRLFVQQKNIGLMEMKDNSLKLIAGEEIFAQTKIFMMVPYDTKSQKVLIGTSALGFYIYDGQKAIPFPTEVDNYITAKELYYGIRISSTGEFALATSQGGLVIMDSHGNLKQIFDKTSGLQDDKVNSVFEDVQGNLWLALAKGIAKIEYASPISFYNSQMSNLAGNVLSITRMTDTHRLVAGTSRGLFVLQANDIPGRTDIFKPVAGIKDSCWSLLPIADELLVATTQGVFILDKNLQIKENIFPKLSFYALHRSKIEPTLVFAGIREGLISLRFEKGKWREELRFENIKETIQNIVEDGKGNLWLGTLSDGLLKVDFQTITPPRHTTLARYNNSHNLPGGEVKVFNCTDHIIFSAGRKIYRFDEKNRTFLLDTTLGKEFTDETMNIFTLKEDIHQNLWFHSEFRSFWAIKQPNNTFLTRNTPLLRIPQFQVNVIYPDPNGNVVWFGGVEGLVCFDTRIKKNYRRDFPVFIREVVVNTIPILYDEETGKYKTPAPSQIHSMNKWIFPYEKRNLTFFFAAPFFEAEELNQYRYILEGNDAQWSAWNTETQKEYTNLDSGTYTFRVQAKNIYGHSSSQAFFQIRILPPWYKTWWAIVIFITSGLFILFLSIRWRLGRLKREKKRLEKTVKERTREIDDKNQKLETQAIQLLQQSEQLKEMDRIKSRFFANISHEFRTPLTLIIGPLEQMLTEPHTETETQKLNMMLRNSRRLLELINQLLNLSKLDSGKMKLKAGLQDIIPFLKGITASFEVIAQQKKLSLSFQTTVEAAALYFDMEKMEIIMSNLLVNALKFTPAGGKILIGVRQNREKNPAVLEISISDTGPGISKEQLPFIFDRFFQADDTHPEPGNINHHNVQGTGIGLALTKEMVLLHHGTIDVQSSVDKEPGTEFTIRLPLGKAHLTTEEIVQTATEVVFHNPIAPLEIDDTSANDLNNHNHQENEENMKDIILVVEDNADARRFIREALETCYTVKEAADGIQGIALAQEVIPDLIVSDIMMPGKDGYELCDVLKKDIKTSHIPIILLTAKASESSVIQGLESGADDYITKPFSTKILVARIKNLIELRRHWQRKIQREMNFEPADVQVSSMDQTFIKEVIDLIEKNLSDQFFNVDQMVKKLYMSRTTLYRKILALTGQSPREFIKSYRLKRGAQLLKANFGNVTEVAFEVGFSSTTYFGKCFKEQFHCLPSDFEGEQFE